MSAAKGQCARASNRSHKCSTSGCSLNWIQGVIVSAAVFSAAGDLALGGALG